MLYINTLYFVPDAAVVACLCGCTCGCDYGRTSIRCELSSKQTDVLSKFQTQQPLASLVNKDSENYKSAVGVCGRIFILILT